MKERQEASINVKVIIVSFEKRNREICTQKYMI